MKTSDKVLSCTFAAALADFEAVNSTISPSQNCTYIKTRDDDEHERTELFTNWLKSSQIQQSVSYRVILEDNDGEQDL